MQIKSKYIDKKVYLLPVAKNALQAKPCAQGKNFMKWEQIHSSRSQILPQAKSNSVQTILFDQESKFFDQELSLIKQLMVIIAFYNVNSENMFYILKR